MRMYHIAGNFLREKTFTNWWKIQFSQGKFLWIARFCCQRMPCPQIWRRKLSWIATKLWNLRKFSCSKVSHYTVWFTHIIINSNFNPHTHWLLYFPVNSMWVRLCLVILTCGFPPHTHDRSVGWTTRGSCRIQRLGRGRTLNAANLLSWKVFTLHHC